MAFYKDEKTHVYTINPDVKTPKARSVAAPDLAAAFVAGAKSSRGKGRAPDPTQVTATVSTGRKRAK